MDENTFGSETSFLESDVERYEQDAEAAQARTERLEDAIGRVAQDARIVESLRENQGDAKEELAEAEELRGRLASETSALLSQLHEQMDALSSERETLLQLEAVGEDISAAMGVLDDRQSWLEQCEEQMLRIGDRLDVALDAYDIGDSAASGSVGSEVSSERSEISRSNEATESDAIAGVKNDEAAALVSDFDLVGASAGLGDMGNDPSSSGESSSVSYSAEQQNAARRASSASEISRRIQGLPVTNEPIKSLAGGGTIYDSPDAQADKLNWYQGLYSDKFRGTCGLCSVQNIARMAGKDLSERDVVKLACRNKLCVKDKSAQPGKRGGTTPENRQSILSRIGIASHIDNRTDIEHVADLVESGRGVIAHVDTWYFWRGAIPYDQAGGHAVVITSVERDARGFPVAFHVCDSGLHNPDYRIVSTQFAAAIVPTCGLNVTDMIIR